MVGKIGIIKIPEKFNNPIIQPLIKFFTRLNELHGLLFLLNDYVKNYHRYISDYMKKGLLGNSELFAGSSMIIRDLSEFPEDRWAKYYAISVYSTEGEEYLNIADELIYQAAAFTISQTYEAFETFLKNILSKFLNQNNRNPIYKQAFLNKISELKRKPSKKLLKEDVYKWETTINNYFSNNDLFSLLREIMPEICNLEKHNNRAINLIYWYKIITEIRHSITHCNRLVKNERMGNWSQIEHKLLSKQVNGVLNAEGYILNPTFKNAEDILVLFDEYAFLIFKVLSISENYEIDGILSR